MHNSFNLWLINISLILVTKYCLICHTIIAQAKPMAENSDYEFIINPVLANKPSIQLTDFDFQMDDDSDQMEAEIKWINDPKRLDRQLSTTSEIPVEDFVEPMVNQTVPKPSHLPALPVNNNPFKQTIDHQLPPNIPVPYIYNHKHRKSNNDHKWHQIEDNIRSTVSPLNLNDTNIKLLNDNKDEMIRSEPEINVIKTESNKMKLKVDKKSESESDNESNADKLLNRMSRHRHEGQWKRVGNVEERVITFPKSEFRLVGDKQIISDKEEVVTENMKPVIQSEEVFDLPDHKFG